MTTGVRRGASRGRESKTLWYTGTQRRTDQRERVGGVDNGYGNLQSFTKSLEGGLRGGKRHDQDSIGLGEYPQYFWLSTLVTTECLETLCREKWT